MVHPNTLIELLEYDPETGKLFWKSRNEKWFNGGKYKADRLCKSWNSRFSGKEALCTVNVKNGYKVGRLFDKMVRAHRVVWAMNNLAWPDGEIDHIDHNRLNNRIENLRDVGRTENGRNLSLSSRNKSGVSGVHWIKRKSKWLSSITVNGKSIYLGVFSDIEDAIHARQAAELKYGFHKNHGVTL